MAPNNLLVSESASSYPFFFGLRIVSAYAIDPALPCEGFGANFITEADRSVTTILLLEEY
ncbi:hypothetical protein [Ramlibacter sp. 2FC]|uniref:hypothetical protein n=1 Tax=Ramlibacter sp. 2FC TaxID=2502188 RepID=UPI001BB106ED|nr:hypothetical protein [Ramlibacter sp. 2FC]